MNYYRDLLEQSTRIEPFRRAIGSIVGPHDRVLEVGAGLGTYSFFAADAGAARVWAVEGDAVVHVAETVAKLNGYSGRVEFIKGWIPEVSLPERATVMIFEDFPPRLIDARTYRLLRDLHEKYLTPDVRCVPSRALLYAAPVNAAFGVVSTLAPLGDDCEVAYGIDWTPTREYVANTVFHMTISPDALAATPAVLADLSLSRQPAVEEVGGAATWTCDTGLHVNGIAYWFDLELSPGVWVSNAPGVSPGSWGQLLLPLDPCVSVAAGEPLEVCVESERLRDGAPGWLSWRADGGGGEVRGHEFASKPASFADVYAESPDSVPRLSETGRIGAKVLDLVDGKRPVSGIAAELRRRFPGLDEIEAERIVVRELRGRIRSRGLREVQAIREDQ